MQNSVSPDRDKEDKQKKSEMEASTAMTVEFLRARLLSERSVSKTARQRADDLEKRVVELEEQLKVVSLQRKKAEKAAAEVLAILENHGMSDISETFDSSSDQEVLLCESKYINSSTKEEETSVISRKGKDTEEFSVTDHEHSPFCNGSLSWRSCRDSPSSFEKKYIIGANKRWNSFPSSNGSSSKRQGRSCRQIKRKETRSGDEERGESILLGNEENEVVSQKSDVPNCCNNRPELLGESSKSEEDEAVKRLGSSSLENQANEANGSIYVNGSGRDSDMEIALEQQAQLIGRYEAEENAQREWEEKFKENNSCSPDSCEHGNVSDITEERDDIPAEAAGPVDIKASHGHGGKSEAEDACQVEGAILKVIPNGFPPSTHVDMGLQDKQCSSTPAGEFCANSPDFSFPGQKNIEANTKGKQKLECSGNKSFRPPSCGITDHQFAPISSHENENIPKGESPGSKNVLQALIPHRTTNELGVVLEALQKAKLSLGHQLDSMPLSREGELIEEPPVFKSGNPVDFPVGYAGLFRVPTDLQFEATAPQPNLLESGSALSFPRNYPNMGVGLASGNQLGSSIYPGNTSRVSDSGLGYRGNYPDLGVGLPAVDRQISSPYLDTTSRSSMRNHLHQGVGLADGDRHIASPYLETTSRISSSGLSSSRTYPDMGVRLATGDQNLGNSHLETTLRTHGSVSGLSFTRNQSNIGVGLAFDERFTANPYLDTASRISSGRPYLDPFFKKGLDLPAPRGYNNPSFPDLMPQMPVNGLSKPVSSKGDGIPTEDQFSFYSNHQSRLNMQG